jgi:hypothetical protein
MNKVVVSHHGQIQWVSSSRCVIVVNFDSCFKLTAACQSHLPKHMYTFCTKQPTVDSYFYLGQIYFNPNPPPGAM